MKLRAKILPKYFEQIKIGTKKIDYREIESITFMDKETGAEIELEVRNLRRCSNREEKENILNTFPDVGFSEDSKIYKIYLGRIIKPEGF